MKTIHNMSVVLPRATPYLPTAPRSSALTSSRNFSGPNTSHPAPYDSAQRLTSRKLVTLSVRIKPPSFSSFTS